MCMYMCKPRYNIFLPLAGMVGQVVLHICGLEGMLLLIYFAFVVDVCGILVLDCNVRFCLLRALMWPRYCFSVQPVCTCDVDGVLFVCLEKLRFNTCTLTCSLEG